MEFALTYCQTFWCVMVKPAQYIFWIKTASFCHIFALNHKIWPVHLAWDMISTRIMSGLDQLKTRCMSTVILPGRILWQIITNKDHAKKKHIGFCKLILRLRFFSCRPENSRSLVWWTLYCQSILVFYEGDKGNLSSWFLSVIFW